jgi:hypothetical protein
MGKEKREAFLSGRKPSFGVAFWTKNNANGVPEFSRQQEELRKKAENNAAQDTLRDHGR